MTYNLFDKSCCFQYVKFIKFESNSQLQIGTDALDNGCFQYVKFIKFESNSQLPVVFITVVVRCFQYVKFIKFESNSQQTIKNIGNERVVFSMSNL